MSYDFEVGPNVIPNLDGKVKEEKYKVRTLSQILRVWGCQISKHPPEFVSDLKDLRRICQQRKLCEFTLFNKKIIQKDMGYVVVLSLPAILLILILAIGCYLIGRARGRSQRRWAPQVYAPPAPPVQTQAQDKVPEA